MTENHRSFAKFKRMINEANEDTSRSHTSHDISLFSDEEFFFEHLMTRNTIEEEKLSAHEFLGRLAKNPLRKYSLKSSPEKRLSIKNKFMAAEICVKKDCRASVTLSNENSNKFTMKETYYLSSNHTNSTVRQEKIHQSDSFRGVNNASRRRGHPREGVSGSRFILRQNCFLSPNKDLFAKPSKKFLGRRPKYGENIIKCVEEKAEVKNSGEVDKHDTARNQTRMVGRIYGLEKISKYGEDSLHFGDWEKWPKRENTSQDRREEQSCVRNRPLSKHKFSDFMIVDSKLLIEDQSSPNCETEMLFDEVSSQDSQKEEFRKQMLAMVTEFSRFDLSRTEIVLPLFQRSLSWS